MKAFSKKCLNCKSENININEDIDCDWDENSYIAGFYIECDDCGSVEYEIKCLECGSDDISVVEDIDYDWDENPYVAGAYLECDDCKNREW
ncbi:MAG: hypothetical protein J6F30_14085 [Cellulosilyticum sp.]|nr:hypothetical protein [Cellulosilyticum sp.]